MQLLKTQDKATFQITGYYVNGKKISKEQYYEIFDEANSENRVSCMSTKFKRGKWFHYASVN